MDTNHYFADPVGQQGGKITALAEADLAVDAVECASVIRERGVEWPPTAAARRSTGWALAAERKAGSGSVRDPVRGADIDRKSVV